MTRGRPRTASPQRTARLSPLLVPLADARRAIDRAAFRRWPVERVALLSATGRLAASELRARHDVPRRRLAAMDGFAVGAPSRSGTKRYRLNPGGLVPGRRATSQLAPGEAIACATGAVLPAGAVAVVRLEWAHSEGGLLRVHRAPRSDQDVHTAGEDVRRGTPLLAIGETLRPYHLGVLLEQGVGRVTVFAPRITVLAVGDEIARGRAPSGGAVADTITPVLRPLLPSSRVRVIRGVPDDVRGLSRRIRAAASTSDLVVTLGGSSVGPRDRTKAAIRSVGELLFEGVRVSVLKRAAVGRVGRTPIVVLPGQVGSAIVGWHEHGLHVVGRCVGRDVRQWERVRLRRSIPRDRRMDTVYLLAVRDGEAIPLPWGVRRASEFLRANALAIVGRGASAVPGTPLVVQRLEGTPAVVAVP